MPTRTIRIPKYRHHKAKGLAAVTIGGRHLYLGPFDSDASHQKYRQVVSEWLAQQGDDPRHTPLQVEGFWGVASLIEAYLAVAKKYYVGQSGKATSEYNCVVSALAPLEELHGLSNAHEFGPRKLKQLRELLIAKGWSRTVINATLSRIRRMFKWAVSEELISPTVLHGLQAVVGLRAGRSGARETEPIKPVPDEAIDRTLPHLTPVVQSMAKLQRLTGMRPCEVVMMRLADIDRSGDTWVYEPADHKNRWRGHQRLIPLGPKAQELLKPYLDRPAETFVFSPQESEAQRNAQRRKNRKSPMTPSQAKRRPKKRPKRAKRERYDTASYRRAIAYGVEMANKKRKQGEPEIPDWCPLQIRHTRATEVRRRYGLDGAQSALGHKNADVTQVYAERNLELAVRIAKETG
jgi:integrase